MQTLYALIALLGAPLVQVELPLPAAGADAFLIIAPPPDGAAVEVVRPQAKALVVAPGQTQRLPFQVSPEGVAALRLNGQPTLVTVAPQDEVRLSPDGAALSLLSPVPGARSLRQEAGLPTKLLPTLTAVINGQPTALTAKRLEIPEGATVLLDDERSPVQLFALRPCELSVRVSAHGLTAACLPPPPTRLIGRLSAQGTPVCRRGQTEWIDRHFEVGFSRLAPPLPAGLEAHLGQLVVVDGALAPPTPEATVPPDAQLGSCQIMQMRDDWVEGMDGIRMVRGAPAASPFKASRIARFKGLKASLTPQGQVKLALTQPDETPWSPLTLTAHYEGCEGKPGSLIRTVPIPPISKGKTATARFPQVLHEAGHHYRLASFELSGAPGASRVAFDLDIPPQALGLKPPQCD